MYVSVCLYTENFGTKALSTAVATHGQRFTIITKQHCVSPTRGASDIPATLTVPHITGTPGVMTIMTVMTSESP